MSECILCDDVITNPVCMECLEKQTKSWLYEVRPKLVDEFKTVASEIPFATGNTICILCKHDMSVCPYCYTKHILTWLKAYPELVEEFKFFFNFHYFFAK